MPGRPILCRTAERDHSLSAVVTERRPLFYAEGADRKLDRPAYVRAGSSLAWTPGGIALVQDDANFLAIVDPATASVRSITLPAGKHGVRQFDDTRGNKKKKLDLEACTGVEVDGEEVLLAFGSGSTDKRERILVVSSLGSADPEVRLVDAERLYARLRETPAFAPTRLNIEGALSIDGHVRLFSRGNGKVRDGVAPANATCEIPVAALIRYLASPEGAPLPEPRQVTHYDLGALDGVPLSFTDAAPWSDAVIYTAAAEASADAVEDGAVTGSAIGIMAPTGRLRWTPVTEPSGALFAGKIEGVVASGNDRGRLYVVLDADDPSAASMLCAVELRGI